MGVRCGLSVQETIQSPVGLLMDLWEVYKRVNGLDKRPQLPPELQEG